MGLDISILGQEQQFKNVVRFNCREQTQQAFFLEFGHEGSLSVEDLERNYVN